MVEGFLIVIVLFGAPILLVIRAWHRPTIAQNPIIWRAGWRFVCALILAAYYGLFPLVIAPSIRLNPFVRPDHLPERYFIVLLVILASIFTALAAQQADYVNRLDKMRKRKEIEKKIAEATAAYFIISFGFWAFSFAVLATGGLIGAYLHNPGDLFALGIYEAIIAVLFVGGWIILIAGALRRFGTPGRPG